MKTGNNCPWCGSSVDGGVDDWGNDQAVCETIYNDVQGQWHQSRRCKQDLRIRELETSARELVAAGRELLKNVDGGCLQGLSAYTRLPTCGVVCLNQCCIKTENVLAGGQPAASAQKPGDDNGQ